MLQLGVHPRSLPDHSQTLILSNSSSSLPRRSFTALSRASSSSSHAIRRLKITLKSQPPSPITDLRRLTSRVVELTRRSQLRQIFEEVEAAKTRYGMLNTIVMNAVMEACVHCGDVDSAVRIFEEMSKPEGCGVDDISYGILLKGLGEAQRVDEAFELLESVEQGTAVGSPRLSPHLIYGLLNALLEAGYMLRANGLVARFRYVLQEEGDSVLLYNLLMKGYTNTDFPEGALTIQNEIIRRGLKPDKMTYNTLLFALVKCGKMDAAIQLLAEMKEEAREANKNELFPDAISYTTLLKGLANKKNLHLVQNIVVEMKSVPDLPVDRTAYTAMVDAMLACGSIKGALCIFGEIMKLATESNDLRPKPHLYLSMMRALAHRGDFDMVKRLHRQMWSDSMGSISLSAQEEADELLMEAALNDNRVELARKILSKIIRRRDGFSWTSRGGMVAVRVEALSGSNSSLFNPYILPQVSLDDPIEKYMTPFDEANPLRDSLELKKVVMRFSRDHVVPVIDEWGNCVGIVHLEDCEKLDEPLWAVMRGSPPCVTTSTTVGRVIDLLLEKKYQMVIVVKNTYVYDTSYNSNSRPVGTFTRDKLFQLAFSAMR